MNTQYEYALDKKRILVAISCSFLLFFLFLYEALTVDASVSFRRIITLDVTEARYFFWIVSTCMLFPLALCFIPLFRSSGEPRYIHFSDETLSAPKSAFSSRRVRISLKDIRSIDSQFLAKTEILHINHSGGKLVLSEAVFENEFKFNIFKADLIKCVSNAKADNSAMGV